MSPGGRMKRLVVVHQFELFGLDDDAESGLRVGIDKCVDVGARRVP